MNIQTKAQEFATRKHAGQRRDGDVADFIIHPAQTAAMIACVTDDPELIAAAWLHDTIEDTDTSYEELVEAFGTRVADLVMEVTHETNQDGSHYFPRLQSRDGIMLKFADRLSNLSDMKAWSEARRQRYLVSSAFWDDVPRGVAA